MAHDFKAWIYFGKKKKFKLLLAILLESKTSMN